MRTSERATRGGGGGGSWKRSARSAKVRTESSWTARASSAAMGRSADIAASVREPALLQLAVGVPVRAGRRCDGRHGHGRDGWDALDRLDGPHLRGRDVRGDRGDDLHRALGLRWRGARLGGPGGARLDLRRPRHGAGLATAMGLLDLLLPLDAGATRGPRAPMGADGAAAARMRVIRAARARAGAGAGLATVRHVALVVGLARRGGV